MKLTAQGWNRDHGQVEIFDVDLYEIEATTEQVTYGPNNPKLHLEHGRPMGVRGATLYCYAEIRLGGSYKVQLKISKGEIARLFHLTHKRVIDSVLGAQKEEIERFIGAQKDAMDRFLAVFPQEASKEKAGDQTSDAMDDPSPISEELHLDP